MSFRQFFPKLQILFAFGDVRHVAGEQEINPSCSPPTSVFLEIFGIKGVFVKIGNPTQSLQSFPLDT
nr:MAG TPA: hypothetical protein [Inoviridae sp.]